jgi:hypothetical protein
MTIAAIRSRDSNTKSIIVAALLLLLTGGTACKRAEFDPLQQRRTKVGSEPLAGAPLLRQAEESSCVWQVNQQAGKVTVSRQKILNQHPQEIRVQTPNGTLVGTDRGEWGGALTLSKGKEYPPEKILDGDVLQIIPTRKGFLIVTGSLPSNEGALWLYSKSINREWTIEKKVDLHGYPLAAYETTSGIWLATGDSIYLLDDKFEVQNHNDMPWLQLHPNSIAVENSGAVYVGMQAFVVRLIPTGTGYRQEWFVGDGCLR